MMRRSPFWIAAAVLVALVFYESSPAKADVDWGEMSARIQENMTEQQVIQTIGYRPNKVEMKTCGQTIGKPWDCKVYTFGIPTYWLMILFHKDGQMWFVDSWSVYP